MWAVTSGFDGGAMPVWNGDVPLNHSMPAAAFEGDDPGRPQFAHRWEDAAVNPGRVSNGSRHRLLIGIAAHGDVGASAPLRELGGGHPTPRRRFAPVAIIGMKHRSHIGMSRCSGPTSFLALQMMH